MNRRPSRSTRSDTLSPYPACFRSLTLGLASALRVTVAPAPVPVVALARALRLARPLPAVLVGGFARRAVVVRRRGAHHRQALLGQPLDVAQVGAVVGIAERDGEDRKSTRLNSSH